MSWYRVAVLLCILQQIVSYSTDKVTTDYLMNELSRIKHNQGHRYVFFPDGNGKLHIIDLEKTVVDFQFNKRTDISTLFYSTNNPTEPVIIKSHNRSALLESKRIDLKKPIKVVVHGWNDNKNGDMPVEIRRAFLNTSDVIVMVVDWSQGANCHYGSSVLNTAKTGEYLASFINWLIDNGVPHENFHFIGHSLGAHVVGIAGRNIMNGKVPYITGLDPALPCWDKYSKRLRNTDGHYVEIIHTNMGLAGIDDAIGSNDFYPNGGFRQPGCGIFGFACSHNRSFKYFAESIVNDKFKAIQCDGLREILERRCSNRSTLNMGGAVSKRPTGIFYLETKRSSPFYFE